MEFRMGFRGIVVLACGMAALWSGCCTKKWVQCEACFVDDPNSCESVASSQPESEATTSAALKLCEGRDSAAKPAKPIPEQHREACEKYVKLASPSMRQPVGYVPPSPPSDHIKVTCERHSEFAPFSGCGGFN